MSLQGSLSELPLPDVIQLVSVSGKTGAFEVQSDDAEGKIYLRDGQILEQQTGLPAGRSGVRRRIEQRVGLLRPVVIVIQARFDPGFDDFVLLTGPPPAAPQINADQYGKADDDENPAQFRHASASPQTAASSTASSGRRNAALG